MGKDAINGDVGGVPAQLVGQLSHFFAKAFDLSRGGWIADPGFVPHAGESEGNGFGVAASGMFFEGLIVGGEFFHGAIAEDDRMVVARFGPLVVGGGPMEIDFVDELAHGVLSAEEMLVIPYTPESGEWGKMMTLDNTWRGAIAVVYAPSRT